jgi:muramidase (phage lysozyme)
MTPNQVAFLAMLAHAEGTDRADDPYRVCYGFNHTIVDLSNHPAITGEWTGEVITVGVYAGERSTAAGRYQINRPTCERLQTRLGRSGFGPAAQDDMALELIKERGALELINQGQLTLAIQACASTWASLPGGASGQPQRSLEMLTDVFMLAGGALA